MEVPYPRDWRGGRVRDARVPGFALPRIDERALTAGAAACWCGQSAGHDWPGKDRAVPHPRP